jgi:ribonuclease HI
MRAKRRSRNKGTNPRLPLAEAMKTLDLERLNTLETIDPNPQPPWTRSAFEEIDIDVDRERASEKAAVFWSNPSNAVYCDASACQNQLGAAAVTLDQNQEVLESRQVYIGSSEHWTVQGAELIGIYNAVELIANQRHNGQHITPAERRTVTILCDSKSALQAIASPCNKSGQHIVYAILRVARDLQAQDTSVRLQWIPGHCNDPGNDAADRLAKEAADLNGQHQFQNLVSREKEFIRRGILAEWENEWKASNKGSHLRRIDKELPSIRARRLYDCLPRNRAYLLTQLRTGHSWLATHGKLHRFREDDKCECGAKETVVHVLVDCPRLSALRQKLRKEVGEAFTNVSFMLGGRAQPGQEGKISSSAQHSIVNAVLDFAEASQRFRSRASGGPQNGALRQTGHHRP